MLILCHCGVDFYMNITTSFRCLKFSKHAYTFILFLCLSYMHAPLAYVQLNPQSSYLYQRIIIHQSFLMVYIFQYLTNSIE
jgi:hypothetical protein